VERFPDGPDSVIKRARNAGVGLLVDVGVGSNERSSAAVALARKRQDVLAAVGIDPHEAGGCDESRWNLVELLASAPEVVAIGETGLDYHYHSSPRETQRDAFARQIAVARRWQKPLIIHTREAPRDTIDVLNTEQAREVGGVFHCFTGDIALAREALELGFFISFSGILTFNSDAGLAEAAQFVPADRLVVETDSPYLSPVPVRKMRPCEPAFVVHTAAYLANLRGTTFEDICETTTANALRLFRASPDRPRIQASAGYGSGHQPT
jgi:TatD DNase family protein